jgi:tRNA pseudouridine55 synthase
MVSAIKQGGVRLYELARRGVAVERAAREVEITRLELLDECTLEVECSAGTYIRSLIDDLGRSLGCGAAMTALRRTQANGFGIAHCATLEQLARGAFCALPLEETLGCYPAAMVSAAQAVRFRNGGALDCERLDLPSGLPDGQLLRVFGRDDACGPSRFLGLGRIAGEQLAIARLLVG